MVRVVICAAYCPLKKLGVDMKKVIVIMVSLIILTGWGWFRKEQAAIRIGDIKITAEEFEKAYQFSPYAVGDEAGRKKFLEQFISRKLILYEAEKLGLDKDKQFLESIQLFWEQSLLKLVLSQKIKEFALDIEVGETEIQEYYAKHKEDEYLGKKLSEVYDYIKWILFKEKESKAIQEWVDSLKQKTNIEIDYELLEINK